MEEYGSSWAPRLKAYTPSVIFSVWPWASTELAESRSRGTRSARAILSRAGLTELLWRSPYIALDICTVYSTALTPFTPTNHISYFPTYHAGAQSCPYCLIQVIQVINPCIFFHQSLYINFLQLNLQPNSLQLKAFMVRHQHSHILLVWWTLLKISFRKSTKTPNKIFPCS